MLGAIVPLVCADLAFINELIALTLRHSIRTRQLVGVASRSLPGLAAVIGALDDLTEPTARLRSVDAVWINRRAFEVIKFPAREMRAGNVPVLALAVRRQDKRAFFRADQYSDSAHWVV